MRILVVGSGGREHALCWKLAQEAEVFALAGNPGIESICECIPGDMSSAPVIIGAAKERECDLVVIGPENPLVLGVADLLREAGIPVFGPGKAGAQLEGSKAYAKQIMAGAGIPTAPFSVFTQAGPAKAYVRERQELGRKVVIKASGNALGKGVILCDDVCDAEATIDEVLGGKFGDAGSTLVVEDRLSGPEFSLLTICSDGDYYSLPIAQDYKRAYDADQGPNTGGMGSYSPVSWVNAGDLERVEETVVVPLMAALAKERIAFRGMLFSGLIMDGGRPYCLEFNVRFGDPETQSVLRRIGMGFAKLLLDAATGQQMVPPEIRQIAAATVVVASRGYPDSVEKGLPITIGPIPDEAVLFHAGTGRGPNRELVTTGGRVIAASASGADLQEARSKAYEAANAVRFEGAWFRQDIAASM